MINKEEKLAQPAPHSLGHYECLVNLKLTQKVGNDWCVIVTDIAGSTVAVKAGRYKEVNMVGAACIAAIRNRFSQELVPYVFGGDGATFLCHESKLEECINLLSGIQQVAKDQMNFVLRIGHVSVKEISHKGGEIYLGFVRWTENESQPFFRGNGISIAEDIIKANRATESVYEGMQPKFETEHVKGLSCRLSPFKSQRGKIMSLLVEPLVPLAQEDALFEQIFTSVRGNFPLFNLNPIQEANKKRNLLGPGWKGEAKILSKNLKGFAVLKCYIKVIVAHLLTFYVFKKNVSAAQSCD